MFGTQTSTASKVVGALLVITGLLGIVILGTDQILMTSAPLHVYGLVVFVIVDFIVGGLVLAKPSKMGFALCALWSLLRIIIQIADVSQAQMFQMQPGDFANYLFNPAVVTPPNPPGVPAAIIDLIILLELVVIVVAFRARGSIST